MDNIEIADQLMGINLAGLGAVANNPNLRSQLTLELNKGIRSSIATRAQKDMFTKIELLDPSEKQNIDQKKASIIDGTVYLNATVTNFAAKGNLELVDEAQNAEEGVTNIKEGKMPYSFNINELALLYGETNSDTNGDGTGTTITENKAGLLYTNIGDLQNFPPLLLNAEIQLLIGGEAVMPPMLVSEFFAIGNDHSTADGRGLKSLRLSKSIFVKKDQQWQFILRAPKSGSMPQFKHCFLQIVAKGAYVWKKVQ